MKSVHFGRIAGRMTPIVHRVTKAFALGVRGADGTVWVQYNNMDHPQCGGWHLHLRRDWKVRK